MKVEVTEVERAALQDICSQAWFTSPMGSALALIYNTLCNKFSQDPEKEEFYLF